MLAKQTTTRQRQIIYAKASASGITVVPFNGHDCLGLMMSFRKLSLLTAGLLGVSAPPSHAQFFICNQTFDVSNVAIGQYMDTDFETSGWWTIGPNQCATVIDEPLSNRFIYVFAQDVFGKTILSGAAPMCVASGRFNILGAQDCLIRGFLEARFYEVDTHRSERWTLFLYPPADQ